MAPETRPAPRPLSIVDLDYLRSSLLTTSRALGALLFMRRYEYDFTGRQSCPPDAPCTSAAPCMVHRLDKLQWRFDEMRALYVVTKSTARLRELATVLPRIADVLRRGATGWRDSRGVVHGFAIGNGAVCLKRCRPQCERCELRAWNAAPAPADDEFAERCIHGRRWDQPCRRCKADDAATDAL